MNNLSKIIYTTETQEIQNHLPEGGPLVVQASPSRWAAHLYQCTSWGRDRLRLASVTFIWRLFHCVCPSHDEGWRAHLPTQRWAFSSFWAKPAWPPPDPPYSPDLIPSDFFCVPGWRKPSKGTFCPCGRTETKHSKSTKKASKLTSSKLLWMSW